MRLVEKKCPNCGGELKFNINDKDTTCEYCNKSYEIERENDDKEELFNADNYRVTLSAEQKKKAQAVLFGFAAVQIVPVMIFAFFIILIIGGSMIFGFTHDNNRIDNVDKIEKKLGEKDSGFILNFSDLTEKDLSEIHTSTLSTLNDALNLHATFLYSHSDYEYVGMYLLLNNTGNTLYDVYKIAFKVDGEDKYYFSAIRYNNVKKVDDKLVVNLDGTEISPFSTYGAGKGIIGYESCQDLFNKNIRGKLDSSQLKVSGPVYND